MNYDIIDGLYDIPPENIDNPNEGTNKMKLKDRPRPWTIYTSSELPGGLIIMDANKEDVCYLDTADVNIDGDEVADLIASAPDMYAELQNIYEILKDVVDKDVVSKTDLLLCKSAASLALAHAKGGTPRKTERTK